MHYSASLAGLTGVAAAVRLPGKDVLWLVARALMDAAGALFGLYLLVVAVLLLVGRAMRIRRHAPPFPLER